MNPEFEPIIKQLHIDHQPEALFAASLLTNFHQLQVETTDEGTKKHASIIDILLIGIVQGYCQHHRMSFDAVLAACSALIRAHQTLTEIYIADGFGSSEDSERAARDITDNILKRAKSR
jgi:hypothetical protein